MNTDTLIFIWVPVFQLPYLNNRQNENDFLPLFQFDTRLLTIKHPKLYSTYPVERNGAM